MVAFRIYFRPRLKTATNLMALWSPPDRVGRLEHCTTTVALCHVTVLVCNWPSHPLIDITSPNTRPHCASLFLIAIPLLMECWFVMRGRWSLGSDPVCPSVHLSSWLSIHRSAEAMRLGYLLPVSLVLVTTGCCM